MVWLLTVDIAEDGIHGGSEREEAGLGKNVQVGRALGGLFSGDNRTGVAGTLHRIRYGSCWRENTMPIHVVPALHGKIIVVQLLSKITGAH